MTDDELYGRFLVASPEEQLRMIRDPALADVLRKRLGAAAFAQLQALAAGTDHGPVMGVADTNLVLVPGIMGSVLASAGLGGIWWIDVARALNRLNGLALAPDGTADLEPTAAVAPVAVDLIYQTFLSAAFSRIDVGPQAFPYDWRKPIPAAADALARAVEGVYAGNGGRPVHLASHSMGGLVIRTALMRHPQLWPKLGKIAFMATPHYGSPAIAGYLEYHFWGINMFHLLGRYLTRETFRTMWGALSLLPAPAGVYPGTRPQDGDSDDPTMHPCANFDLYDAAAYQLSLSAEAEARLQLILDHVADLHRELAEWHFGLLQEHRDRMLGIAGVGQRTLFRLAYQAPTLGFGSDRMKRITSREKGSRHREGDGRVPLAAAELEYVQMRYVRAEHGRLPTVPAVVRDVLSWFTGGQLQLATTPQAALAADLGAEQSSATPALIAAPDPAAGSDDPGYLDLDPPTDEQIAMLDARLEAGDLPEFERLRLL